MIDLSPHYLQIILQLIQQHLPQADVWAFGSRVTWTAKDYSDLDLVLKAQQPLPPKRFFQFQEALEESDLPIKVDVLDWHQISTEFRENIKKRYDVIYTPKQKDKGSVMNADWPIHSLSEFIDIKHGFAFKGKFFKSEEAEDYLLTPGNFAIGGGFKETKFKYYEGPVPEDYLLVEGDIVVTMTDLSKQADTLGYSALVPTIKGKRLLHNQRVGLVQFKNNRIDKTFLYFLLRSKEYRHHVVSTATGSTVKHTSPTKITSFKFQLPPYDIQVAIGQYLLGFENKIELNRQTNQTLEQIAQAIFKSWFVDFEPVKAKIAAKQKGATPAQIERAAICAISGKSLAQLDRLSPATLQQLKTTAALFPDALVASELGEIPQGWEEIEIKRLAKKISKGTTARKADIAKADDEETIQFLKVRDISDAGEITRFRLDKIPESIHNGVLKRSLLEVNDLLFTIAGTIGRVAVIEEDLSNSNCNQAIAFIRLKNPQQYLELCRLNLIGSRVQNEVTSKVVQGVQANFSLTGLGEIKILIPDSNLLKSFNKAVSSIVVKQRLLLSENRKLSEIRDTLLPKLLSGELLANDEVVT